jgi:hypothetical protein
MESNALSLVLRNGVHARLNTAVLPVSEIEIDYSLANPDPIFTLRFSSPTEVSAGTYMLDLPSTESGVKSLSVTAVRAPLLALNEEEQVVWHVRLKSASPKDLKEIVQYVQAFVCHPL